MRADREAPVGALHAGGEVVEAADPRYKLFVEQPVPPPKRAHKSPDHPDPDLPTAHAGKRTPRTGSWLTFRPCLRPQPLSWPELRIAAWRDTYATLLLYTQIVGKVRLALVPKMNQWWNVPLYLTTRGLTTRR